MSEQPAVKLDDFEEALMFVNSTDMFDNVAWLQRDTGEVLWHCDDFEDFGSLPDDSDDEERYVAIPNKRDLGLGKPLALEFARTHLPECFDQVRAIFSRRGAYARFKDLLERNDNLGAWYEWEEEQMRQALRQWCVATTPSSPTDQIGRPPPRPAATGFRPQGRCITKEARAGVRASDVVTYLHPCWRTPP